MNKKIVVILIVLVALIIIAFQFFSNSEPTETILPSNPNITDEKNVVEVTDSKRIEMIKNDSYLDILLQIKTFDELNISYEPLLEAAMRIARELDLYQTPENGVYIEFVPRDTIHTLIYELSGIRVENPIIIEDFYYLYDSENDYYYIVPSGADWLKLGDINSIHYTSTPDQYIISCSAENVTDYFIKTTYPNVDIRLKYKPANTYIKYQLISINVGKSTTEVLEPEIEDYSLYEDLITSSGEVLNAQENINHSGEISYSENDSNFTDEVSNLENN